MSSKIRIAALSLMTSFATACSQPAERSADAPAAPAAEKGGSSPAVVAPAPAAPSVAPAAAPAAPAAAPAAPAVPALASADGEIPGTRVDITELKRNSSGTVTLKFTLHSDTDKPFNFTGHVFGDATIREDYYSVGGVHLLDPVGKKKYLVVRDSANNCLCSDKVPSITKSKVSLWAKFPAPPDDVKTVTVVIPHFAPFDDLAIR